MKYKISILVLILVCMLSGCKAWEEDTRCVIDYRFTEFHEEERVAYKKEYNWVAEKWYDVPYTYIEYVPDKYELMWLITYQDGHTERKWEECTRFEYENALKELSK